MDLPACRRHKRISIPFTALLAGAFIMGVGFAQQKPDFAGDYMAISGPLHVALHIAVSPDGNVSANIDSPQQGLFGLPCADVQINGPALSFNVPNVRGGWTGVLSADHKTLSGVWKQGNTTALVFTRGTESGTAGSPAVSNSELPAGATPSAAASALHAATLSSSAPNPQSASTCPAGSMADYWDGSSWKPMTMAVEAGKR